MKYTVKRGDSLSKIAAAHKTSVAAIVAANAIKNPNLIQIGQVLIIPDAQSEKPTNNQLYNVIITCLDAIEDLPEFKQLEKMLYG